MDLVVEGIGAIFPDFYDYGYSASYDYSVIIRAQDY